MSLVSVSRSMVIYYKKPFYSGRTFKHSKGRHVLPLPLAIALYPDLYYGSPQAIKRNTVDERSASDHGGGKADKYYAVEPNFI
jgi:hypothetical protein